MINTRVIEKAFEKKEGGRPAYHVLGRELGCSAATARGYVLGLVLRPSHEMLLRLAEYLEVSVDELYIPDEDEAEKRRLQPLRAGALVA